MSAPFTESDLRGMFRQAATEAQKHARCGQAAACRRNALEWVNDVLDEVLALALPDVRDTPPSTQPG